jgi:transposase
MKTFATSKFRNLMIIHSGINRGSSVFETENEHFCRYANFLAKHIQGIISHARYHISSGMVEDFNNKIKTMRRKAYGFNDDEYFFLKIIDISK